ncbi:hypothetical protein BDF22DRAFT_680036 [Syncephalis plumigaleata]|nr:hypothetical protein BDF22DRAFT_680036 [Syncephalis plumigaleata]
MSASSQGVTPQIMAIRSTWQFVYLNAFLNTFSDCIDKLEVDPMDLEEELVRGRPGPVLSDIHRALLKPLYTSKGNESWEKTLSRLLAYKHTRLEDMHPLRENPIPSDDPKAYHSLSAMTKLNILWLLCDLHLQKNQNIKEKIDQIHKKSGSGLDKNSLNILNSQPVGYDKQQRSYWFFGDWPRVYRREKRIALQPYDYDAWEVVATTLTELEGLIEVFRKEFLNAESELKNALQRLLTRATNIQQQKQRLERSRERTFALLQNNTVYESRTRNRQIVKRYTFENSDIDSTDQEEEEEDYIKQYSNSSRALDSSDHNMRLRSSRIILDEDEDEEDDAVGFANSESDKDNVASSDLTSIKQHKRKRRPTQSSIELSPDTWLTRNDVSSPSTIDNNRNSKYIKQHTVVAVQVPSPSASRQQSTLDAWTRSLGSKSS